MFGFRTNGSLTLSSPSEPGLARGNLDSAFLFSLTGGYRIDDATLIEFRYSRNSPGITLKDVTSMPPKLGSSINQFAGDFTYEFSPENSDIFRPYILGTLGATRLTVTGQSHTRLHLGLGLGAKYWISRHLGVKVQGAWMPTVWNRTDDPFAYVDVPGFMRQQAITASGSRWVHQIEFSAGPVFRF